jgi:hypothetical protein
MLKVIYIVGHERSGSTFLDILLGNHPEIVDVGELCTFYRFGPMEKRYCSCGKKIEECSFWKKVKESFTRRIKHKDFYKQIEIQDYFERKYNMPRWILDNLSSGKKLGQYLNVVDFLYQSIAEVSGKQIIVDSSKSRLRAYWISRLNQRGGINIYLVHLIRDGRGVVWSHKKLYKNLYEKELINRPEFIIKKSTLYLTSRWLRVNTLSKIVGKIYPTGKAIYMRYEDLVQDPVRELERISGIVGFDVFPLKTLLEENRPLSVAHLVGGNSLRMSKNITPKPDYEWEEKLPDITKRVFWGLAGWYAKKYGYKKI